MSLYNTMRPTRFDEVFGQEKLVKVLKDNLSDGGHLPNAMLFVGTRGTGKTTVAKIVAKQLNCESPLLDGSCCNECPSCKSIMAGNSLDVIELDAASNNGVDNIRSLIEQVQYKPVGNMKIIILDEVHMLSTGAFNALLKVMEEPPKGVLFILCTTEFHKIPATILSRCRKFQFETISMEMIVEKLSKICEKFNLKAESGALRLVAKAAKGSMRDAESIFENFLDVEDGILTENMVMESLGYTNEELSLDVLNSMITGDPSIAFAAINETVKSGRSLVYLLEECFRILMDVVAIHMGGDITAFSSDSLEKLSEIAFSVATERLFEIADGLKEVYELRSTGNLELLMQSMVISLVCRQSVLSSLLNRVFVLEKEMEVLKSGIVSPSNYSHSIVSEENVNNDDVSYGYTENAQCCEAVASEVCSEHKEDFSSETKELEELGFTVVDESPFTNEGVKEKKAEADEFNFFGDFARQFFS